MESEKSKEIDELRVMKLVWLSLCLFVIVIFFQDFPLRFLKIFSWRFIQREGAYPWVALLIGIIWLILKRREIVTKMNAQKISKRSIATGIPILLASIFLHTKYPYPGIQFEVLFLLMAFLAFFVIFFIGAMAVPTILVALYGFTVSFPVLVSRYLEVVLSMASLYSTLFVLRLLGFTAYNDGQLLYFMDNIGKSRAVLVNSQCAGIASITIFIILFVLISLDMPLSKQKTAILFLFGIVGTFLQNIIRILSLIVAGHFYGMGALWTVHGFAGYVIFAAWFALFAYVYLTQTKKAEIG